MAQAVETVLKNLYDLKKAHRRLLRGSTPSDQGEKEVDRALQRVLQALEDERVQELYRQVIVPAQPKESTVVQVAAAADPESSLFPVETLAVRDLHARPSDIRRAASGLQDQPEQAAESIPETSELGRTLETLHQAAKSGLKQARRKNRKAKKEKKRQLWRGIWSAIFGVGLIIANTRLPAAAAVSYSIGLSALHQAGRDLSES